MTVVADAGPLIALRQIERLDMLQALFDRVTIPSVVADEVAPSIPVLPAWISVSLEWEPPPFDDWRGIDAGERSAIQLALALDARLIVIDDLDGRNVALRTGLNLIGTAGVLLLGKQQGMLAEVRPLLDHLVDLGFFLGRTVRSSVLSAAGEADDV